MVAVALWVLVSRLVSPVAQLHERNRLWYSAHLWGLLIGLVWALETVCICCSVMCEGCAFPLPCVCVVHGVSVCSGVLLRPMQPSAAEEHSPGCGLALQGLCAQGHRHGDDGKGAST